MFVGFPELLHGDQIRSLRQFVEVIENARVRSETIAELVAEEFVGGGELSVRRNAEGGDKNKNRKTSSHCGLLNPSS